MKRLFLSVLAILSCVHSFRRPGDAADWPMYRADAARSGYTAEPLPEELKLRWVWRAKHPPRPAWPSIDLFEPLLKKHQPGDQGDREPDRMHFDFAYQPIVIGGTVVFGTSADDKVIALDAATGKPRWVFIAAGPIRFAPAGWRNRLFVASDGGWLHALSLADGKLLWKHRGGPDDRLLLGNQRMISRWPARGGPVVFDGTVYYSAGIWPTDGVYLHALDAASGKPLWTNNRSGGLALPQPHCGRKTKSGVSPQGYLLANDRQLFVPTGRAVPAVFCRSDGRFEYYHLGKNEWRGGTRAMLADRFLFNAGCLFEQKNGALAGRCGRGLLAALPGGIVQAADSLLSAYRWKDSKERSRKGKLVPVRSLQQHCQAKHEGTAREVIVAGDEAVVGGLDRVSVVSLSTRQVRWTHDVEGDALGLAVSGGRLVVSTDRGLIYCFDGAPGETPTVRAESRDATPIAADCRRKIDYAAAAAEIVRKTGVTSGVCADLGCGTGELALELARQTDLHICAIESDPTKVAAARQKLDAAGMYGVRVSVHQGDPARPPYPRYFANLIVSTRALREGSGWLPESEIQRIQRPRGGAACLGKPGQMKVHTRGPLPGAANWTHQNADAANTICSADRRIKGPFTMLWFRDVDFEIANRHGQGPAPLYNRGCLVAAGVDGVCALDAYNGHTLWMYPVEGLLKDYNGMHHDVGVGDTGSVFCLSDDSVYVKTQDRCPRIDLFSGKKLGEFRTPTRPQDKNHAWGFLAYSDGMLYGTVANEEHRVSPRYGHIRLYTESVSFFAMDAKTGQVKWRYEPRHSIRNNAITIAGGRVYLIDRPLALEDRVADPKPDGRHRPRLKPGEQPAGVLLALDAATGSTLWKQANDVFGTQLAVSLKHGLILMYYQAVLHDFFRLPSEIGGRMAAFDTATGKPRWDIKANYLTRPVINGDVIYAQGGAWKVKTGKTVPFKLDRGLGCGQVSGSTNLL